jgi:hypothetical protein
MDGQTYNPLFETMAQSPQGDLLLEFNLRSPYDSTQVWVDGAIVETVGANAARQIETVAVPVLSDGPVAAFARGFRDGSTYDSVSRAYDAVAFGDPVFSYANDLDLDIQADDFQRNGFLWLQPAGFSNGALHSNHPYADDASLTATLAVPIRIAQTTTLSFDEIAIVEPGDPGTVFGDGAFWDYVVVEGTTDGKTWIPVADGWDARDDAAWLTAFNTGGSGTSSMYRPRAIVLNDTFAKAEVVLLRFRLYADSYVTGWGWAIDNIAVTPSGPSDAGDLPGPVALEQNYPNPFNPSTSIAFSLDRAGPVKLRIYDTRGRLVRTLVDEPREAGPHRVTWDGRDDRDRGTAAGVYFYRMDAGGQVLQRKMTLIK